MNWLLPIPVLCFDKLSMTGKEQLFTNSNSNPELVEGSILSR